MPTLQTLCTLFETYWPHLLVIAGSVIVGSKVVTWFDNWTEDYLHGKLEAFRADLHANEITSQLAASDALCNILESFLPEVLHGLEDTAKTEISQGKISSLDWTDLGKQLWAKARAEAEAGITNYMHESGEKDGEVLAAIFTKKYLMKQAALQKGLLVPHN